MRAISSVQGRGYLKTKRISTCRKTLTVRTTLSSVSAYLRVRSRTANTIASPATARPGRENIPASGQRHNVMLFGVADPLHEFQRHLVRGQFGDILGGLHELRLVYRIDGHSLGLEEGDPLVHLPADRLALQRYGFLDRGGYD